LQNLCQRCDFFVLAEGMAASEQATIDSGDKNRKNGGPLHLTSRRWRTPAMAAERARLSSATTSSSSKDDAGQARRARCAALQHTCTRTTRAACLKITEPRRGSSNGRCKSCMGRGPNASYYCGMNTCAPVYVRLDALDLQPSVLASNAMVL
jgi:hypothetical protein